MTGVPVQDTLYGRVSDSIQRRRPASMPLLVQVGAEIRQYTIIYNEVRPVLAGPFKLFLNVIPERISFDVSQALVPLA